MSGDHPSRHMAVVRRTGRAVLRKFQAMKHFLTLNVLAPKWVQLVTRECGDLALLKRVKRL